MNVEEQIISYLDSQSEDKRADLSALHQHILQLLPKRKLWFLDGKDETGKVISNPNIGYGKFTISYKDGSKKEFYQIGLSGNKTGISVYIMGLKDKKYLPETIGTTIGKASVTSYCIKFKILKDLNLDVLDKAIHYAVEQTDKN